MEKIDEIFDTKETKLYFPQVGIHPCKINIYNEFIHDCAKIFFQLLDKHELVYYVFAGSAVGYLRDGNNIPWVDDYDIIISKNQIEKWENNLIPALISNGFKCQKPADFNSGGYQVLSCIKTFDGCQKYFQCDVFYTFVDSNNYIRNRFGWGLYHVKNIPSYLVYPPVRRQFHKDLNLPFFNNIEAYVDLEYGDVMNKVVFHIEHEPKVIIEDHWSKVYEAFNSIKAKAIQDTIHAISSHSLKSERTHKLVLNGSHKFQNDLDILKHIYDNNIGYILIDNEMSYLDYVCSIKYYFPDIKISLYLLDDMNVNEDIVLNLNYVDKVILKDKTIMDKYENLIYCNKPIFKLCQVITFGTFDLFHVGHDNILKNSRSLGSRLIVGISSDELNLVKGKETYQSLNDRIENVMNHPLVDDIFIEKSLEKKNLYIQQYGADVLVMGDDWLDKFNWVSCLTRYFPRTPEISSTMLRYQLRNK
jgi:glycerol-3-phosphate cytidylyltransferase